jgi:hypothetical protein
MERPDENTKEAFALLEIIAADLKHDPGPMREYLGDHIVERIKLCLAKSRESGR